MAEWYQPLDIAREAEALNAERMQNAENRDILQFNRLATKAKTMELQEAMRNKDIARLVASYQSDPAAGAMPTNQLAIPGASQAPARQLLPPSYGTPLSSQAQGQQAQTRQPEAPDAVGRSNLRAIPSGQDSQQLSPLQQQLTTYQKLRQEGKIDAYEYGNLVTSAITSTNSQAKADLEEFGKLTKMVKEAGGPAKFGGMVNSGFFDGVSSPAILKKLKSIDYSKMKEEPDFMEYDLPSGGKIVSGRDQDGKPYTHFQPKEKEVSKTLEQLRRVFTDKNKPEAERDAAWEDFKFGANNIQLIAITQDKYLPKKYREFAQSTLDAVNKQEAKKTKLVVEVKQEAKKKDEDAENIKADPLIDKFAKAIISGQMAPSQLKTFKGAKTYQRTLARVLDMSPGFSISKSEREYKLAGNPEFQKRQLVLEALPETISSVVEAGKKLENKYGLLAAAKMASIIKKEGQSELMREFITLRNDAVLEIAYAMRMAGMSEGATALEQQGVNENMAPKEFDAWRRAQFKAILPRLKRTMSKTGEGIDVINYIEKQLYGKERTVGRGSKTTPSGASTFKSGRFTVEVE